MRHIFAAFFAALFVSTATAQTAAERVQEIRERLSGNGSSAHGKTHSKGVDREAAIGHALFMAIDGSGLWHCAQKTKLSTAEEKPISDQPASDRTTMRDPGSVLEQHSLDAFRSSDRLFQAVSEDEHAKPNRDGHSKADGESARSDRPNLAAHDRDTRTDGQNTAQGNHEACERFYQAAREYSRALEASCSSTRQAGGQNAASIGSGSCSERSAEVALINHAVKDAVEAVGLQQMLRHHGERDRSTQALERHAQEMLASSRKAIESISRATAKNDQVKTDQGTTRRDAARPVYNDERAHNDVKANEVITVDRLAHLGRDVIRSVEQLNQWKGDTEKK